MADIMNQNLVWIKCKIHASNNRLSHKFFYLKFNTSHHINILLKT